MSLKHRPRLDWPGLAMILWGYRDWFFWLFHDFKECVVGNECLETAQDQGGSKFRTPKFGLAFRHERTEMVLDSAARRVHSMT